ncbi:hypothetical protein VUR80DRAFT_1797 [Thermomyces stellatus]
MNGVEEGRGAKLIWAYMASLTGADDVRNPRVGRRLQGLQTLSAVNLLRPTNLISLHWVIGGRAWYKYSLGSSHGKARASEACYLQKGNAAATVRTGASHARAARWRWRVGSGDDGQ